MHALILSSPECPDVSMAVPKKRTYSEVEAWSRYMAPIQPPALMKIHSICDLGKM